MAYVYFNNNPRRAHVGDCVIRAISKIMDQSWETTYVNLASEGLAQFDIPISNVVWSKYLIDNGFRRYSVPNTCPACYTIKDFCYDNPLGDYIVATGSHVVAVTDGDYYDIWDSGDEAIQYYYMKEVY